MEVFIVKKEKGKLRELIEKYGIKDMKDVSEFVKMLTTETIQEVLDVDNVVKGIKDVLKSVIWRDDC